jgi:hypothetical protein
MANWNELKIEGIADIRKVVAEFDVGELIKTPWAKFKVKIKEDHNGKFTGYTNLKIKNEAGHFFSAVGFGDTVEEALKDTILYLLTVLNEKEMWSEEDFGSVNPYDF